MAEGGKPSVALLISAGKGSHKEPFSDEKSEDDKADKDESHEAWDFDACAEELWAAFEKKDKDAFKDALRALLEK